MKKNSEKRKQRDMLRSKEEQEKELNQWLEDLVFRIIDGIGEMTNENIIDLGTFKVGYDEFFYYHCIENLLDRNCSDRKEFLRYCYKVNWNLTRVRWWVRVRTRRKFEPILERIKQIELKYIDSESRLAIKDN